MMITRTDMHNIEGICKFVHIELSKSHYDVDMECGEAGLPPITKSSSVFQVTDSELSILDLGKEEK